MCIRMAQTANVLNEMCTAVLLETYEIIEMFIRIPVRILLDSLHGNRYQSLSH